MKNCRRVYEYRIGGVTSDVEATSATNTWVVLRDQALPHANPNTLSNKNPKNRN